MCDLDKHVLVIYVDSFDCIEVYLLLEEIGCSCASFVRVTMIVRVRFIRLGVNNLIRWCVGRTGRAHRVGPVWGPILVSMVHIWTGGPGEHGSFLWAGKRGCLHLWYAVFVIFPIFSLMILTSSLLLGMISLPYDTC